MTTLHDTYQSANHEKFTHPNRLYQWHLHAFLRCVYDMLQQTNPRLVLDAGCGEGFVTSYLARQDPAVRVTGIDVSPEAIAYAQEHFGELAHFRTGNLYKLPFSDHSFDTVVCSEVLEHLDDTERAVSELKRVARKYVIVTVPREPYFKWLNDFGRRLGVSPDPGHVNFWTKKGFQEFISAYFDAPVFAWKHVYQLALCNV
ncbi:MAG: class I SAM-dependent methyltransferase [Rhodothermales bacterium]